MYILYIFTVHLLHNTFRKQKHLVEIPYLCLALEEKYGSNIYKTSLKAKTPRKWFLSHQETVEVSSPKKNLQNPVSAHRASSQSSATALERLVP